VRRLEKERSDLQTRLANSETCNGQLGVERKDMQTELVNLNSKLTRLSAENKARAWTLLRYLMEGVYSFEL